MESQFEILRPWIPTILSAIRKEIKTEYLPRQISFCRTHFGHRPLNRLSWEEVIAAFEKELLSLNEELIEWVVNRWVFRHGDLYQHFVERLRSIHPDFEEIKTLSAEESEKVLLGAEEAFGAPSVYLFSVLNSVVFPPSVFSRLQEAAEKGKVAEDAQERQAEEQQSLAKLVERHQREIRRLEEKYEGKLAGVLKKYAADVEALKRQIRSLQQQLHLAKNGS